MELKRLTESIYYSENVSETDRPVIGYICGQEKAIMVDAGASQQHYLDFLSLLEENQLKKPDLCLITHWHWDHSFGLHALDIESYAHQKTNEKLKEMAHWTWDDASMKQRLKTGEECSFVDEYIREEYPDLSKIKVVPAQHSIEDHISFDCGHLECHYFHLPSAHSDDSMAVYVPSEKVLFIGDAYCEDVYNDLYRDVEKTKKLYEVLNLLDIQYIVPGHGDAERKEEILEYLYRFYK